MICKCKAEMSLKEEEEKPSHSDKNISYGCVANKTYVCKKCGRLLFVTISKNKTKKRWYIKEK